MRLRRLILRAAGATVAAALALTACSSGGGGGTTKDGKTVLKVIGWKGGGKEPANVAQINAAFEAANPNIKVDYTYAASDGYQNAVNTQLLGGTAPDVLMVDDVKAALWSKSGYLADLGDQSWVSTLKPNLQDFSKFNGKTLVFPQEVIGLGLFANLDQLRKAGVTAIPKTWPEFTSALSKLKAAGVSPMSFANKGGWTGEIAALSIGASVVSAAEPGWDAGRAKNQKTFAPDWTPVLDQIKRLGDYISFKDALSTDEWTQGVSDFESGKAAFLIQGAWNISDIKKKAAFKFAYAPVPGAAAGGTSAPLLYVGTGLAVNAHSKVSDAAKKYVAFWAQDSNLTKYLEAEAAISPLQSGTTPAVAEAADFQQAVDSGKGVIFQPQIWRNTKIEEVIKSSIQALMLGSKSSSDVLSQWDQQFAD